MTTALVLLIVVFFFKQQILSLLNGVINITNAYSRSAENHAKRLEKFTEVDLSYAEDEAKIRAKARIKALKESHKDLPEL